MAVDRFIDADASAIVRRAVVLHDCKSAPVVPAGYTASGGSRDYSVEGAALPTLIDVTGETSPVLAVDLRAQFSCAEPWAAWLALPLDGALRDARAATSFRVYVGIDPGIKGYAYRLPPEVLQAATDFLGAGKKVAELWGDTHTGFSPIKPATQAFHVRMAASGPLECTVSAGRSGGIDLAYARVLRGESDRRFFVPATDRPVLIVSSLDAFPGAPGVAISVEISTPHDTSCSADLAPKVADTWVAALRLGVPRGLLEEEGAVDFRTESVVVFAKPTALQRGAPGAPPTVTITIPPRGPECPGGLPPKYEPKTAPPPPPPQKAEPQLISGDALAVAYVIRRGSPLPTKVFVQAPAPPCLPMP
jgi:hypothetical protein